MVQIINVQSSELPVCLFFSPPSSGSFLHVRAAEVVSAHSIASSVTVSYEVSGPLQGRGVQRLGMASWAIFTHQIL